MYGTPLVHYFFLSEDASRCIHRYLHSIVSMIALVDGGGGRKHMHTITEQYQQKRSSSTVDHGRHPKP